MFLGQLYAAEALIYLDRLPEAMHYLKPDSVTDVSTTLPETQRNGGSLFIFSPLTDFDSSSFYHAGARGDSDTSDLSLPKPTGGTNFRNHHQYIMLKHFSYGV